MLVIDGFRIDAQLEGGHSFTAEVTEHPVEEGTDESDNISNNPVEVVITGIVTDTPIGVIADLRIDPDNASRLAYEHLKKVRKARQLVTVQTSLDTFDNMAMISLDVPTSVTTGDAFEFTATFRQVKVKENERSTVPVSKPIAAKRKNRGKRPPKPIKDDPQNDPIPGTPASSATLTIAEDPIPPETASQIRAQRIANGTISIGDFFVPEDRGL